MMEQKFVSPEKQELLLLEKEGLFVFHGSGEDIEIIDPRQAINIENIADGQPAVFASPAVDFAIFHAIVNSKNFPQGTVAESGALSHDDGTFELGFKLSKESFNKLADSVTGCVYVFNKNDFTQIEGRPAEYKSNISIQPIKKITVLKRDLPDKIEFT